MSIELEGSPVNRKTRCLAVVALSVLLPAACAPAGGEAQEQGTVSSLGDFVLENVHGGQVRLSDFDGKVIVMNFWATWCPPCLAEIPQFNELAEQFKDRGVQIVGMSLDNSPEVVRAFERKVPLNYPSLMSRPELVQWFGGLAGVPTTLILDLDGEVVQSYVGFTAKKWFEEDLEAVLSTEG
ncbi:MAG: TlpA disulfide reductase family protein [Acidobacteriota bacterium]